MAGNHIETQYSHLDSYYAHLVNYANASKVSIISFKEDYEITETTKLERRYAYEIVQYMLDHNLTVFNTFKLKIGEVVEMGDEVIVLNSLILK